MVLLYKGWSCWFSWISRHRSDVGLRGDALRRARCPVRPCLPVSESPRSYSLSSGSAWLPPPLPLRSRTYPAHVLLMPLALYSLLRPVVRERVPLPSLPGGWEVRTKVCASDALGAGVGVVGVGKRVEARSLLQSGPCFVKAKA